MERAVLDLKEPQWFPCPKCGAEHSQRDRACWDCERRDGEKRLAHARRDQALKSLPADFAWATFDAPELARRVSGGEATVTLARKATVARKVVLVGPAGQGKTSLAVAMLREWVTTRDGLALFVPSRRLSGGAFELPYEYMTAPLVVLDDLGSERAMTSNAVPDLVQERHDAGLALWVTTGLTREMVSSRYGDGVARRVFERAVVIPVGGAS